MRFSALHKAASYLMVGSAFAALALSRELDPAVVLLTILVGAASFFCEPARQAFLRRRFWTGGWNVATVLVFALTLLDALRGDALHAGVRFLCFLLVNKLCNRRASRDYLQAYVVSFLMLVAGAALSSDLSYAACFLAYVVFATWTLTLFHLRREMEENYLLKHASGAVSERVEVERILNSRRIVGAAFLGGTALVALGIFVSAALVFFLFPRFGFGFFATQKRRGSSTIGFSDRVDLNEVGRVKDNPQVVMRIELDGGAPAEPLHLRGISLDHYQRGRWTRTLRQPSTPLRRWDGLWIASERPPSAARVKQILAEGRMQRVYLDPLDTPVLFGAAQPLAFDLPAARGASPVAVELESRGPGEVIAVERHVDPFGRTYATERKAALRYTVWSDEPHPAIGALLSLEDQSAPAELKPYLALPSDLPPRIAELARSLTAKSRGPYAKALAIERHLASHYRYTLDLERDPRYEPLDDFLFVTRAGHCEYFASAMAVLLRTIGIPTRSVNGFLGSEWNQYGHYLAVRQSDAHSWVEVYLPQVGWRTFDPTPSATGALRSGAWNRVQQLLDTVEMAWFKWVIEYDLARQVDVFSGLRRTGERFAPSGSPLAWARAHPRPLGATALAALVAFAFVWWRRRRREPAWFGRRAKSTEHAQTAFERALKALERRGHPRRAAETGRELATRVLAAGDPGAPPFAALVELYYASRFGGVAVADEQLTRLAAEVRRPPPPSAARASV